MISFSNRDVFFG